MNQNLCTYSIQACLFNFSSPMYLQSILDPADDPNALEAFVSIFTGDPGMAPDIFMDQV